MLRTASALKRIGVRWAPQNATDQEIRNAYNNRYSGKRFAVGKGRVRDPHGSLDKRRALCG